MKIGITMGDPAGIGPEVVLKALSRPEVRTLCELVVLGDAAVLGRTAAQIGLAMPCPVVPAARGTVALPAQSAILDFANAASVPPGKPSAEGGRASLEYIERAIDLALAGALGAIVTGPINKQSILMAGSPMAGHTELLAARTGTRQPVMMLAGERLRVALVTTHLAIKRVAAALTPAKVEGTLLITAKALRELFGIPSPRIAVCGLNPHASDGGRFGNEEAAVIAPAIEKARSRGIDASGPHPADAVFFRAARGEFDVVVAMYHDQGLIPLKLLHFEDAVNITLGLPIIRTSVDHGTAYDLVGRNLARADSMVAALRMAHRLATAGQAGAR